MEKYLYKKILSTQRQPGISISTFLSKNLVFLDDFEKHIFNKIILNKEVQFDKSRWSGWVNELHNSRESPTEWLVYRYWYWIQHEEEEGREGGNEGLRQPLRWSNKWWSELPHSVLVGPLPDKLVLLQK